MRLLQLFLAAAAPLCAADVAGDLLVTQRKADNSGNVQRNVAAGNSGAPLLSAGTNAPAFGALNLAGGTNIVTGTLPLANGGLGFTSAGTSGHVVTSNGSALAMVAPSVTAAQISDSTAAGRTLLTAADVAAQKTALSLAKADVGLGSVENTALSTWGGSTNIVTLGNVTTGTWSGTAVAVNKGGTGQTSYTNGQLLIGNTTSGGLDKATLTAGTGITITNGAGSITINSTASGGGSKTYAKFSALDGNPPASNYATFDTRNSVPVLDFDDSTEESTVFLSIMPEAASLGSGLTIRIHWAATTATTGQVRWGVQLERGNTDLDSDSFDTAAEAHSTTSGTSGTVTITEITTTNIDGITAGDGYRLKVYRDVTDTTNDTMTGDAELVWVEVRSAS